MLLSNCFLVVGAGDGALVEAMLGLQIAVALVDAAAAADMVRSGALVARSFSTYLHIWYGDDFQLNGHEYIRQVDVDLEICLTLPLQFTLFLECQVVI